MLQAFVLRLCVDRVLNVALMRNLLTEQCHLRIGNMAPTLGKSDVLRELARFVRQAEDIGTGYFDAWRSRDTIILELDCVMTDQRGVKVTVPSVIILRLTGGLIDDIRVYIERAGPPLKEH